MGQPFVMSFAEARNLPSAGDRGQAPPAAGSARRRREALGAAEVVRSPSRARVLERTAPQWVHTMTFPAG